MFFSDRPKTAAVCDGSHKFLGSEFQNIRPATEKARRPYVVNRWDDITSTSIRVAGYKTGFISIRLLLVAGAYRVDSSWQYPDTQVIILSIRIAIVGIVSVGIVTWNHRIHCEFCIVDSYGTENLIVPEAPESHENLVSSGLCTLVVGIWSFLNVMIVCDFLSRIDVYFVYLEILWFICTSFFLHITEVIYMSQNNFEERILYQYTLHYRGPSMHMHVQAFTE